MDLPRLETLLANFPTLRIAVLGDFFLDRYWEIDAARDEPSLETGLTAYQIVGRHQSPGAAGTVAANLAVLGVGTIHAVGFVGDDGDGIELLRLLDERGIDRSRLFTTPERMTPCYTKPMRAGCEMSRFDIKNRTRTPPSLEQRLIAMVWKLRECVDAIMVMDQLSEEDCGVVTATVRKALIALGSAADAPILYADSRERIALFRETIIKCNDREAAEAFNCYDGQSPALETVADCGRRLIERTGRTVFITLGARGQLVVDHQGTTHVPAVPVHGTIDICGAGDAASSAIVAALCAGATPCEAAELGNLAASITIRKIGETGTASPAEIREAWKASARK